MKRTLILTALLILLFTTAFSQNDDYNNQDEFKTLFGGHNPHGFYGAFSLGYCEIDARQAILFGGRLEWIVSHSIGFGFGGNGFINEYHWDPQINQDIFVTGGYGGFYIEPIFIPNFPVHLSFPVLLGAGGISYVTKDTNSDHNMIEDSEAFLVAEPGAEIELNITRNFRLALGATYRFTTPFDVGTNGATPVGSSSLQTWSFMMTFKFGRF